MEIIFFLLLIAVIGWFVFRPDDDQRSMPKPIEDDWPKRRKIQPASRKLAKPKLQKEVLQGSAYVVDGDSIVIHKTQIRLYGIDAPELNHPYGNKAKWALVALCKGQTVKAEVVEVDSHGRTVAHCFLEDGRDLSAEMVKQGLAIDWLKFSNGKYRDLEVDGVRKKLWLADARQKGRMHVWAQFETRKQSEKNGES